MAAEWDRGEGSAKYHFGFVSGHLVPLAVIDIARINSTLAGGRVIYGPDKSTASKQVNEFSELSQRSKLMQILYPICTKIHLATQFANE